MRNFLYLLLFASGSVLAHGTHYQCNVEDKTLKSVEACSAEFNQFSKVATPVKKNTYQEELKKAQQFFKQNNLEDSAQSYKNAFEIIPTAEALYQRKYNEILITQKNLDPKSMIGENFPQYSSAYFFLDQDLYAYSILEDMQKKRPTLSKEQYKNVIFRKVCLNSFLTYLKKDLAHSLPTPLIYETCYK